MNERPRSGYRHPSVRPGRHAERHRGARGFDDLVAEAEAADVAGWDFGWLEGRATEQRPPWGYVGQLGERLARANVSLDLDTGGGEVLAEAGVVPPTAFVTESWPPNLARARALLGPLGFEVVDVASGASLPFGDATFDLVTSRHPATVDWSEIGRVLRPGGTYFAQHVGPASGFELIEFLLGPQVEARRSRHPDDEAAAARAADLEVVSLRSARLRIEIDDVGAAVYLLRKLPWWVPGFTVEAYRDRLRDLHEAIVRDGPFVAHSARHLIEARRPN